MQLTNEQVISWITWNIVSVGFWSLNVGLGGLNQLLSFFVNFGTGVVCLEENNLVVYYYINESEIWPDKRGGIWWEWLFNMGQLYWEISKLLPKIDTPFTIQTFQMIWYVFIANWHERIKLQKQTKTFFGI